MFLAIPDCIGNADPAPDPHLSWIQAFAGITATKPDTHLNDDNGAPCSSLTLKPFKRLKRFKRLRLKPVSTPPPL